MVEIDVILILKLLMPLAIYVCEILGTRRVLLRSGGAASGVLRDTAESLIDSS